MRRLWRFLRAKDNRAVLSWVGAGLVALATGAWAVATHVWPKDERAGGGATPASVCASGSTVIAGRDIGRTTIAQNTAGTATVDCPPAANSGSGR